MRISASRLKALEITYKPIPKVHIHFQRSTTDIECSTWNNSPDIHIVYTVEANKS